MRTESRWAVGMLLAAGALLPACSSGGAGDAATEAGTDVRTDRAPVDALPPDAVTTDGPPEAAVDGPMRAVVPVGGACDPDEVADVCVAGSSCVGAGAMARCVADGARGGRCRAVAGAPPCDTGLACDDDRLQPRCRTAVAEGGACDPAGVTDVCVPPARCVTAMGMSTCRTAPYTMTTLPAPAWVDACATGGQRLALAGTGRDDTHATAAVMLPFAFRFFGMEVTQLWPSTNGYAVFSATAPRDGTGGADRFPSPEDPLVAAYWDNLVLRAAPGSDLCVRTVGAAPARQLVVEWLDAHHATYDTTHLTFELVLAETTGTVDLVYRLLAPETGTIADFVHGQQATIGIQSARGAQFLAHRGPVSTAAGLRFTPR